MRQKHPIAGGLATPRLILTRRTLLSGMAASAGFVSLGPLQQAEAFSPKAARFRPPPAGSRWAFTDLDGRVETIDRADDGAYGTWTVVRYIREKEGEPLLVSSYNIISGNWIVSFAADRTAVFSADPDDRRYRWPVSTGGYWRSKYSFRDFLNDRRFDVIASWRVVGFELLQTPFGRQRTIRLRTEGRKVDREVWFGFDMGVILRDTTYKGSKITKDRWLSEYTLATADTVIRLPPWDAVPAEEG